MSSPPGQVRSQAAPGVLNLGRVSRITVAGMQDDLCYMSRVLVRTVKQKTAYNEPPTPSRSPCITPPEINLEQENASPSDDSEAFRNVLEPVRLAKLEVTHDLAIVACDQFGKQRVNPCHGSCYGAGLRCRLDVLADEPDRTITQDKMGSPHVRAAEAATIMRVAQCAVDRIVLQPQHVHAGRFHVCTAGRIAHGRTEPQDRSRTVRQPMVTPGPFADQDHVTGAVRDITGANIGVLKPDPQRRS